MGLFKQLTTVNEELGTAIRASRQVQRENKKFRVAGYVGSAISGGLDGAFKGIMGPVPSALIGALQHVAQYHIINTVIDSVELSCTSEDLREHAE